MKSKKNNSRVKGCCWSFIISILALGVSCYAAFICDKRIEADWMGVLVGILSLLVTVLIALVGWAYYTSNGIIDKKINELTNANLLSGNMQMFYLNLNNLYNATGCVNPVALLGCIESLKSVYSDDKFELVSFALDGMEHHNDNMKKIVWDKLDELSIHDKVKVYMEKANWKS